MKIGRQDMMRLAAESGCDLRTVASYVAGKAIRPSSEERIEEAAKRLRIPLKSRPGSALARSG